MYYGSDAGSMIVHHLSDSDGHSVSNNSLGESDLELAIKSLHNSQGIKNPNAESGKIQKDHLL